MSSYNWFPVIGICALLPALHAGNVNVYIMATTTAALRSECVGFVVGTVLSLTFLHDGSWVCVFVCFHAVQIFLLQFCPASSPFGCLTAVHYCQLNLLWIIFSQSIEVVFPTAIWARRSTRYTSRCYFYSWQSSHFWFGGLIGGSAELHSWCAAGQIRLSRGWIDPMPTCVYRLGSHLKAWKATAHHDLLCSLPQSQDSVPGSSTPVLGLNTKMMVINARSTHNKSYILTILISMTCSVQKSLILCSSLRHGSVGLTSFRATSHRLFISRCTSDLWTRRWDLMMPDDLFELLHLLWDGYDEKISPCMSTCVCCVFSVSLSRIFNFCY